MAEDVLGLQHPQQILPKPINLLVRDFSCNLDHGVRLLHCYIDCEQLMQCPKQFLAK